MFDENKVTESGGEVLSSLVCPIVGPVRLALQRDARRAVFESRSKASEVLSWALKFGGSALIWWCVE